MTGSSKRERVPRTDQEWARDTQRRIEDVEHQTAARVGSWVLSTQEGTGWLIASHVNGGSILLGEVPPEGTDPDGTIVPPEEPFVEAYTAKRIMKQIQTGLNIANTTDTVITWGTDQYNTGFTTDSTTITIPEDGVYALSFQWQWANNVNGVRAVGITVNGTSVPSNSLLRQTSVAGYATPAATAIEVAHCLNGEIDFLAGDVLRAVVWQNSGGTLGGGGPYFGNVRGRWEMHKVQTIDLAQQGVSNTTTGAFGV